jgi:hypothetical protein
MIVLWEVCQEVQMVEISGGQPHRRLLRSTAPAVLDGHAYSGCLEFGCFVFMDLTANRCDMEVLAALRNSFVHGIS